MNNLSKNIDVDEAGSSNLPQPTKPIIDLFLFRHGESEANTTTREFIGGRATKSPLTNIGKQQAMALGRNLLSKGIRFDKVYCSTATRALETAVIAVGHGRPLITNIKYQVEAYRELEELDQGLWEGAAREKTCTPKVLREIKKNLLDFKAPKGESQREVGERINKFINKHVLTHNPPKTIGIFFHGLAIKCWLQNIMNFDPKFIFPMQIDNCSATRIQYNSKTKLWAIKFINLSKTAWV